MAIDPGRAAGQLSFAAREYVFCSLECARAFAAAPEDYVAQGEGWTYTRGDVRWAPAQVSGLQSMSANEIGA